MTTIFTSLKSCIGAAALMSFVLSSSATAAPGEPGTIDATWGGGTGSVITAIGVNGAASPNLVTSVLQGDGRLIVAGLCDGADVNTSLASPCLVRYLTDGTPDASFGTGGIVHQSWFPNKADYLRALFVLPDQKLLVIADCTGLCLARLNTDGSFDTTFGPNGTGIAVVLATNPSFTAFHAGMHPDGKVSVFGACVDGRMCVARLLPSGQLDGSYGDLGWARVDPTAGVDAAVKGFADADGSVLLAGTCNGRACVARIDGTGSLDTTFNGTGVRSAICPAPTDYVQGVRRQRDGKYLLGATVRNQLDSTDSVCVMRLNGDGSIDSAFASGGSYLANFSTSSSAFGDLHIQPDGRIIVSAACSAPGAVCARRLNGDGMTDPSFANANGGTLYFTGGMASSGTVTLLTPLSTGNFYLVNDCKVSGSSFGRFCSYRFEGGPQAYRACALDLDGDGRIMSATDALLLMRLAAGFKGNAIVAGVSFPATATRTTGAAVERHAIEQCGFRQ